MMQYMINFLVQSTLMMSVFYVFYKVILYRNTFFVFNRYFLLGSTIFSLLVPVITYLGWLDRWIPSEESEFDISILLPQMQASSTVSLSSSLFDWTYFAFWTYVVISLTLLVQLCYQLYKLYSLCSKSQKQKVQGFTMIYLPSTMITTPFSFFDTVFLPQGCFTYKEESLILAHEGVHIAQHHSIDIFLMQVIRIFFWVNPMVYLYIKAIKLNHEFLVDSHICFSYTKIDFLKLLLTNISMKPTYSYANYFFKSPIKSRIMMMNQSPTPARHRIRYLMLVPLAVAMLYLSACNHENASVPDNTSHDLVLSDEEIIKSPQAMPTLAECTQSDLYDRANCSNEKLFAHLYKYLKYPTVAKENGVEGVVIVQFVVNKNGYMQNLKLARDIGAGCGEESIKVLKMLKNQNLKWTPGLQDAKPVNVLVTLPVKFKLQ